MTKLEALRSDLVNNPTGTAQWQLAIVTYLRVKGYQDYTATISIGTGGNIEMDISPDLTADQQTDLTTQMKTLKSVQIKRDPKKEIEYIFIYL